jgi:hypothetical protein
VRRIKVVATTALIAIVATVAVPGQVGSRAPRPLETTAPDLFTEVRIQASVRGSVTTIQPLDPGARSDGSLDQDSAMLEPASRTEPPQARPAAAQPKPDRGFVLKPVKPAWRHDPEISWYGPGLIGNGTACGKTLTRTLVGVAHRSLPCGTLVSFRWNGRVVTAPVVDRGPYVSGRIFDLAYALCKKLGHCFTGPIDYRFP